VFRRKHADVDTISPLDMTGRAKAVAIKTSQLMVHENAPHGQFLTHTDRVHADLLAFIQ
jgi:non-heme chloroperoxidase